MSKQKYILELSTKEVIYLCEMFDNVEMIYQDLRGKGCWDKSKTPKRLRKLKDKMAELQDMVYYDIEEEDDFA